MALKTVNIVLLLAIYCLSLAALTDGLRSPFPCNSGGIGVKQNMITTVSSDLIIPYHCSPRALNMHVALSVPRGSTKLPAVATTSDPDSVPVRKFPPVPTQKECLAFVIPALGT